MNKTSRFPINTSDPSSPICIQPGNLMQQSPIQNLQITNNKPAAITPNPSIITAWDKLLQFLLLPSLVSTCRWEILLFASTDSFFGSGMPPHRSAQRTQITEKVIKRVDGLAIPQRNHTQVPQVQANTQTPCTYSVVILLVDQKNILPIKIPNSSLALYLLKLLTRQIHRENTPEAIDSSPPSSFGGRYQSRIDTQSEK